MKKTTSSAPAAASGDTGTVHRVARLLGELVDRPGSSVATLASRLGLPRSTTHRLLALLRDEGFAENGVDGGFTAGTELVRIATRLSADLPLARIAAPVLDALCARFRETALLTILDRRRLRMFYAAAAAPPDPMRYDIELNRPESLAWGATGRSLLAWMEEAEIDAVVARDEHSPVGDRPVDRAELRAALAKIRKDGHATTRAHRTADTIGIAAPFFGGDGRVLGNVALLIPAFRFRADATASVTAALREAAATISDRLGHRPPAARP